MRTTLAFTALLAACSTAIAAPHKSSDGFIGLQPNSQNGHNSTGDAKEFVILLDRNQTKAGTLERTLDDMLKEAGVPQEAVKYTFNNSEFIGASVEIAGHCQKALQAMSEVAYVEEKADIQSFAVTQQQGSPWGLQRISNDKGASGDAQGQDFTYSFEDASLGAGVDIYIIDTGVRVSHAVFGGRATEGWSFTTTAADGDGHGTHVAGTAAGAKFGVAEGANIIAVKVLGDDGSGSSSDTIKGMDWVINNHNTRKAQSGFVGSIMSMSWGLQGTAQTVDDVIQAAVDAGIHVSVAAGNDGADACSTTPAHLGGSNSAVITVGSVNIENAVSSFSNIGTCVDVYAPGEQILSAWNTGDDVINFLSGTSMATPHNSGVMAYLMAQDPTNLGQNPAALKSKLLETARQGVITGSLGGSANLLLSNGVNGNVAAKRSVAVEEKRTVTGSPASWAKDLVGNLGRRWSIVSRDSPLRY